MVGERKPHLLIKLDSSNWRFYFSGYEPSAKTAKICTMPGYTVVLMTGERSYFSNESVVRGRHVYKHIRTPGIDEALSVEKELRNLHDNFAISVVKNEPYAGARSQLSTRSRRLFENPRLLLYSITVLFTLAIRDNKVHINFVAMFRHCPRSCTRGC